ncbi:MAG: hypothetical protein COV60_03140 [Candidatus Magasanikbacteria bacterium CG11_big_fil_rev_8_21_14_0_20_43_7]|uniref:Uncharacterized protein n=1 Tax=Candidatus Magasanikbacteria bacterium CG11_big_fil_rev_8_21_14_0_20_43_7 TaxID=1974654 RepID=A0A2H0N200_9BACT|nr:MAG: hypothetical protein COV60_03140 [Candidatus Magasanikbacteria bacterium CG11_big_fil_rev_8_21_14_0_20_43_7]
MSAKEPGQGEPFDPSREVEITQEYQEGKEMMRELQALFQKVGIETKMVTDGAPHATFDNLTKGQFVMEDVEINETKRGEAYRVSLCVLRAPRRVPPDDLDEVLSIDVVRSTDMDKRDFFILVRGIVNTFRETVHKKKYGRRASTSEG